jgi:hypothetical protein
MAGVPAMPTPSSDVREPIACQLIGTLVLGMAGMALDPMPANLMRLQRIIQPLP